MNWSSKLRARNGRDASMSRNWSVLLNVWLYVNLNRVRLWYDVGDVWKSYAMPMLNEDIEK